MRCNSTGQLSGTQEYEKKIRIAYIFEDGKIAGPQMFILRLIPHFSNGIENIILMPTENSAEFQSRCDISGIKYKTLRLSRITKEWRVAIRYIFEFPIEIYRIINLLRINRVDILYVVGGSWQFKGIIAGKLAKLKIIWRLNDTYVPKIIKYIFGITSYMADYFIFASQRTAEYYSDSIKTNVPKVVISPSVDLAFFDHSGKFLGDEDLINKWSNDIVIGTIVNVNPIKGLETFIRAAAKLNETAHNIRFVVVGPIFKNQQRYFESLQRLCNSYSVKNIEFVGPRNDVRALLKRFDIYVCSSNAESSPNSVREAMAMGKPIVSTDVGDVAVYVKEGEGGYIVPVGESFELAGKILLLIRDENLRRLFGVFSRDIAASEMDFLRCINKHVEVFKICESHRND
jgi:glycosyltransferase involved in cell wall biosynthesis